MFLVNAIYMPIEKFCWRSMGDYLEGNSKIIQIIVSLYKLKLLQLMVQTIVICYCYLVYCHLNVIVDVIIIVIYIISSSVGLQVVCLFVLVVMDTISVKQPRYLLFC